MSNCDCTIDLIAQEEYSISFNVLDSDISLKVIEEDTITFSLDDDNTFHFSIEEECCIPMKVYEGTFDDAPIPDYEGPYIVTPKRNQLQKLITNGKRMTDNVSVVKIPEYQVQNTYGTTFVIGGE